MSDLRHTDDNTPPPPNPNPQTQSTTPSLNHPREANRLHDTRSYAELPAITDDGHQATRVQRRLRSILHTLNRPNNHSITSPSDFRVPSFTPIQSDRPQDSSSTSTDDALRFQDLVRRRTLDYNFDTYGKSNERDTKRRKIDDDSTGQIGRIKLPLDLLYDDGGLYQRRSYPVQNLLRDDKSVYCSRKSTCNLLFQHQSKNYFSIQKLVIKAPGLGYSSPVTEGMVFIFNDVPVRDILDNTKNHAPEHRHEATPDDDNDDNDPELSRDYDNDNDSEYISVPAPYSHSPDIGEDGIAGYDDDDDMDELEWDNLEFMPLQARAGRGGGGVAAAATGISPSDTSSARRLIRSPNHETVVVCGDPPPRKTGEGEQQLLMPHAKFYIPPRRSIRSTIVFSPPLYCRFIMIKLWAEKASQNIDIESISAYGYYGKRFFPAAKFR